MKKMLLIGSVGCGKTTFLQYLLGEQQSYLKTQAIYTQEGIVDTPGEYIDSMWFKPALRQASMDVDVIVFLHDATRVMMKIPPTFSTFFTKPCIGIITKTDIADAAQIEHARSVLTMTGATRIFEVCSLTGEGFEPLIAHLAE